jgi:hypothetical protein
MLTPVQNVHAAAAERSGAAWTEEAAVTDQREYVR